MRYNDLHCADAELAVQIGQALLVVACFQQVLNTLLVVCPSTEFQRGVIYLLKLAEPQKSQRGPDREQIVQPVMHCCAMRERASLSQRSSWRRARITGVLDIPS